MIKGREDFFLKKQTKAVESFILERISSLVFVNPFVKSSWTSSSGVVQTNEKHGWGMVRSTLFEKQPETLKETN